MHACFHGGGGRPIGIIRDLAKNMKAMSLKVRAGGGGYAAARRRRRRRRRRSGGCEAEAEAEAEEDARMQEKEAAAAASTSAKIAPQEADGDRDAEPAGTSGSDRRPREAAQGAGGRNLCEKCRCQLGDDRADEVAAAAPAAAAAGEEHGKAKEEDDDREWVAEPEPGVLMTLVSRPDGTNALRRIRFREELFDGARAAQSWWADNYDYIVELYSVVQSDRSNAAAGDGEEEEEEDSMPVTPCQSEDDDHRRQQGCDSGSTFSGPSSGSGSGSGGASASTLGSPILGLVVTTPTSSTSERGPPPPVGPTQADK